MSAVANLHNYFLDVDGTCIYIHVYIYIYIYVNIYIYIGYKSGISSTFVFLADYNENCIYDFKDNNMSLEKWIAN